MSTIDQYRYKCVGVVHCPTPYRNILIRREGIGIDVAIYKLLQNIPTDEPDFQGKPGDILLGGGSGEAPALRILMPEALNFWTNRDEYDLGKSDLQDDIAKAYWSATQAFVFGERYCNLGWLPTLRIEDWLTQHVLSFLVQHFPEELTAFPGPDKRKFDGSICRLLTSDEDKMWNWLDYR